MARIKDKDRDRIDFGKSKIEPLFQSIFFPTLLSMVFASLFTVGFANLSWPHNISACPELP